MWKSTHLLSHYFMFPTDLYFTEKSPTGFWSREQSLVFIACWPLRPQLIPSLPPVTLPGWTCRGTCPSQHSVMVSVTHSHKPQIPIPILFILVISRTHTRPSIYFIYSYSIWKPKQSSEQETNQSKSEALSTTTMEDLPPGYRPNVGVCLINSDNLVTPYLLKFILFFALSFVV